jgi:hypothetical protein
MTPRDEPEQQQAELLWKYIEELKRSDNPEQIQFVAVTRGDCPEVVGLMETAAEAYTLVRAESAPNCSREAIRQRLQAVIAGAAPAPATQGAGAETRAATQPMRLPAWLLTPLSGRSTGWAVAVAALVALIWTGTPRLGDSPPAPAIARLNHSQTLDLVPQLIAGTLEIEKERAAWEHFNHCEHCFQIFEEKWRAARSKRSQTSQNSVRPDHTLLHAPAFALWRPLPLAERPGSAVARPD